MRGTHQKQYSNAHKRAMSQLFWLPSSVSLCRYIRLKMHTGLVEYTKDTLYCFFYSNNDLKMEVNGIVQIIDSIARISLRFMRDRSSVLQSYLPHFFLFFHCYTSIGLQQIFCICLITISSLLWQMHGCGAKQLFYVLCYQDISPLFFQLSKKVVDPGGRLFIYLKVPLLGCLRSFSSY